VASAQGKIIPSGRTKIIQPFETGVVRAIHVRDGQSVKAGDLLIELDTTMSEAERNHIQSDLIAARLDIARLRAALADGPDSLADFQSPEGASPALIARQQQYLTNQTNEHRSKIAALDRQKAQREAERATIAATIEKLQATIAVAEQRVDVRKQLWDQKLGSKLIYLTDLQDLVSQQQELVVQQSRQREAEAALAAIHETRAQTLSEYRRSLSSDLAAAETKAGAQTHDLVKAQERVRLQSLTAPIEGVVQQLAVHTVGGVVTPAQALMVVVPSESRLEIEAMLSNRDIGFVRPGQNAEIKVDTFNFTRYGLLHGQVLSVSQDAITRDKSAQEKTNDKMPGA
jgi:hemolysin D